MTSSEKRMLLPILRKLANRETLNHRAQSAAEQLYARLTRPVSLKSKAAKLRQRSAKQSARASHNQETAKIREEVMKRADGKCENCFKTDLHLQLDHWLGGWGRRREQQSVETTWALCAYCHFARTEYVPDTGYWNGRFERHTYKHGYPFQAHIIHADPAKAGGAP